MEQFIDEFLFHFENYYCNKLYNKLNNLRIKTDESLEIFSTRIIHLCHTFILNYIPSISEWCQHLISLSDEKNQLITNKSKSCNDTHSHADLDLYENTKIWKL